jgi:acyl transferase domain-containing protein/acyl-CoA synthetase (AMP-forming)/AMP-acid ligase II/acyl carrier protein
MLERAAVEYPEAGLLFIADNGSEKEVGLDTLLDEARSILAGLQAQGLQPGDSLILQLDDKHEFLQLFWACILGGIIPAPIAPTVSLDPDHKTFSKFLKIYTLLDYPVLVLDNISKELETVLQKLVDKEEQDHEVVIQIHSPETLRQDKSLAIPYDSVPEDLAFLQFTSGSTGNPKGVMLTHGNLMANMYAIVQGAGFSEHDSVISWMPLYHDMGLIGAHLATILGRTKTLHMRPFTFIKRPLLWLKKIAEHRATITVSPNFGYKWVLEKVKDKQLEKLDLSSLRLIFNGAEPISVDVMNSFLEHLGALCKLDARSMFPVYGMAEASLAVAFPPQEELPVHCSVSRSSLRTGAEVRFVDDSARDAIRMIDEGAPVAGVDIRITNDEDSLLDEGYIGHIQIKGPNVTSGYFRNPRANKETFCEGWLRTGDLGFVRKGRLTVTGRSKDIIFVNGQNFYAHDLEEVVAQQPGIDSNGIAVAAYRDEDSDEERVILFMTLAKGTAVAKGGDLLAAAKPLILSVGQEINEVFGFYPHFISLIKRRDIPKTSSGKVQRHLLLESFHNGAFDQTTLYYLTLLAGPNSLQLAGDSKEKESGPAGKVANFLGYGLSPTAQCEEMLRDIWSEVLGIPSHRIKMDNAFAELGGTSIKAIEIIGKLEDKLGFALPQYIFAKANTIVTIVEYIHEYKTNFSCASVGTAAKKKAQQQIADNDIAIIGMGCRFPGAEDSEQFWQNLSGGVDSISEVPPERWDIRKHYSRGGSEKNKSCSKWGGFLDNIRLFDAGFFQIPPEEADHLDPQQRLFLEVAWETMSCGGYPNVTHNHTGVFVGASFIGYTEEFIRGGSKITIRPSTATGNLLNMIAARVSHFFDLKGPAITLDTACSSSLAAIHLACQSLRAGECDRALAGGISLNLNETPYIFFSEAGALSPDGVCRVFDEEANGFVPGEGVGAVLLKPYDQAVEDADNILAIIKGSALNNDGHSMGLMAPNPHSQADVIRQAYINSGVPPEKVSYVEAHGTATQIGDAIEVRSLSQVFNSMERQQCAIGSVKSNIGHLLAASGIAGLIKVILSMQHRQLAPSLHCRQEKKSIKFGQTPFFVNKTLQPWTSREPGEPLIAGINSFGFGGTNCHLIVQEAPSTGIIEESVAPGDAQGAVLITLSAHHQDALDQKIQYLHKYLSKNPNSSLHDVSYTLNARKSHFPQYRWAMITDSRSSALEQLDSFSRGESPVTLRSRNIYYATKKKGGAPRTVFMFSGQGAQYTAMGKVLYENEPMFREAVDLCQELIVSYFDHNLVELICGELSQEELNKTAITQPVTFVMDLALAMFWQGLGLKPAAVMGHSVGEYVAAVIAGIISLEDALKMVVVRGRLMAQLPEGGGMAAVFASREELTEVLDEGYQLDIAAFNGPDNIVLSGSLAELKRCLDVLKRRGIDSFQLQVSHAFHSAAVEPMIDQFSKVISGISFQKPTIPFISNLTGEVVTGSNVDRDYWLDHVRKPVNFAKGIETLCHNGYRDFLEIGARDQLAVLASKIVPDDARIRSSLPNPRKNSDQYAHLLGVLGEMYTLGFVPDWRDHYEGKSNSRLLQFPNYPFQRQVHWISLDQAVYPFEEMIKRTGPDRFSLKLNKKAPLLQDNRINDNPVMPAAGQCELLLSCFSRAYGYSANWIRSIAFSGPWTSEKPVDVLFEKKGEEKSFQVVTGKKRRASDKTPTVFTSGTLGVLEANVQNRVDIEKIIERCPRIDEPGSIYDDLKKHGLNHGPYFQNLKKVHGGDGEAIAEISLTEATSADAVCVLHPGLLDSVFQAVGSCVEGGGAFLPLAITDLIIYKRPSLTGSFAHIRRLDSKNRDLFNFDVDILSQNGRICIELKGLSMVRLRQEKGAEDSFFFKLDWQPQQRDDAESSVQKGSWLLFGDRGATGDGLGDNFLEKGLSFVKPETLIDTFDEGREEDYVRLFDTLKQNHTELAGIVHCGGCSSVISHVEPENIDEMSARVHTIFLLCKALQKSSLRNIPFYRISINAQVVEHDEILLDFSQSLVTGFLRSAAKELSGIRIRSLDFSAEHSNAVIASLTLAEMGTDGPLETAYRSGKRYVNSLVPWQQEGDKESELKCLPGHVYWIVGGLQGVGAECAIHLVENGATRLAISGRTVLPPREEFEAHIRGEDKGLAAKLELIQSLEADGCELLYQSGDAADSNSMLDQYVQIKQKWGAIHGVVHSALHLEDAMLIQKEWESFTRVLAPRVWGSVLLDRLTRQEPLEFFTLFSSLAGVTGNIGQCDYTATNCFMDNFVQKGNRQGPGRGRSMQWGQWSLGKQASPIIQDFMSRNSLRSILPDEGMSALDTLMAEDSPATLAFVPHRTGSAQTAAMTLNAIRERTAASGRVDTPKEPQGVERSGGLHREREQQPEQSAELSLEQYLIGVAAEKLEINADELDPDMNFLELGADSMIAMALIRDIEEALEIELYPTLLFEYPSITDLCGYLHTLIPDTFSIAPARSNREAEPAEQSIEQEVDLLTMVTTLTAEKLEMEAEELDAETNFLELGADSMLAMALIRDVEKVLDVELYPTLLFEYPTIFEFVQYLESVVPSEKCQSISMDSVTSQTETGAQEREMLEPVAVETAEKTDDFSTAAVMQLLQEQQSWFKEQFQAQRNEISELRELIRKENGGQ